MLEVAKLQRSELELAQVCFATTKGTGDGVCWRRQLSACRSMIPRHISLTSRNGNGSGTQVGAIGCGNGFARPLGFCTGMNLHCFCFNGGGVPANSALSKEVWLDG